ncbi:MAG: hypothetical protein KKE11_04185 [Gammaproteobacteria bacterium]|nr:hypothetical protein [Gammaproteobacteria bacterium]
MKTWISRKDVLRSPQAALRIYASGNRRSRFNSELTFASRSKQHFLVRRLKSQLKAFSKLLTQEAMGEMERG